MKKYALFKYFIKNRVFTGGDGGRAERPVPIEDGVGCSVFTPNMVWGRGECMKTGAGMLKPALPSPVAMSKLAYPDCTDFLSLEDN